ncbi:hypothetical protein [Falsiroseomonas selenitidurans]|uniref:Uncharacterized protein n=1 Tax=Falsiroseomonas selenitidurans TaxID=2716335 RepID=A0ABX1E8Z8_9PROT|nr:hypothetical protein [Falsiroseomonas selenitidurans]NKC33506.1 hypothetical protein [Falsiroseomonas selenitidurans]
MAPIGRLRFAGRVEARDPTIFLGSSVTIYGEFRDPATNALAAAEGVVVRLRPPTDAAVELEVETALVSTGVYAATVEPALAGVWLARLMASGVRYDERQFTVAAGAFAQDPDDAAVLVTDEGEFILLDDGTVMEG